VPASSFRTCVYFALFALLLTQATSQAQEPAPRPTDGGNEQETIHQLVDQIKQLQQEDRDLQERIRILEARQPLSSLPAADPDDASPATTPAPAQADAGPAPPTQAPVAAPRDWHDVHNIQWRGFGEVDYQALNQRQPELGTGGFVPGSAGNFYTGDFDLFLTSRLTSKASVLSEIVFEEQDGQSYSVDLRRMLLKYDYDDHLRMSFGRYQTNIGYYNWAFQSAAWLQTTTDRPLVMQYSSDGGLLPTQAIGVSVTGAIPSGKLDLHYVFEYGSSDTIRPDLNGDGLFTDENNGNQTNLGFFARPDWLRGLQFGSSYYHDQISNRIVNQFSQLALPVQPGDLGPSARYEQTIVNAYAVYVAHGVEFLNEAFLIRQTLIGGSLRFDTPAFYSQFSKQFGRVRPFVRYQYVNANPDINSVLDDVGLRYGPSFGSRYDLNDYMALTAQLDHTVRRGQPDINGLQLQWAFTF